MAGHGGVPVGFHALRRLAQSIPKILDGLPVVGDAAIPGFRHFLGNPDGTLDRAERFKINGQDLTFETKDQQVLQGLMGRLAHRMSLPYEVEDNRNIPSGYTYLLQLMAHDLVQSSVPISIIGHAAGSVRNHRQARLRLDTIYGAGPDLDAFAYALDDPSDLTRTRLRLGPMAPDDLVVGCPFRDISRVLPTNQTGVTLGQGYTDALIIDARNDDHAILSQFTALIHWLHNGIVTNLLPPPDQLGVGSIAEAAYNNYFCARAAVTLIYRNIIRKDLMKRVLHPDVYHTYKNVFRSDDLLEKADERIPLEFSHAGFRFGHPMVRNTYIINDPSTEQQIKRALLVTSSRGPLGMPLGLDWIVNWSYFFEINGSTPNFSQKIRPTYSPGLLDQELFQPLADTNQPGLACRDLFSSAELGLWSVDRLIDKLSTAEPKGVGTSISRCVKGSRILFDKDWRKGKLTEWLSEHSESSGLTRDDISVLADDPPLLFFVQFEAWADQRPDGTGLEGASLGVLGSTIVAEVIFAALADQLEWEQPNLKNALSSLNKRFFSTKWDAFSTMPELDTMSQLIAYVARLNGLEGALPKFL